MNVSRLLAATVLVSSLSLPAVARATTIQYTPFRPFTGPSFATGGVTATAEHGGNLAIDVFGLGVEGGFRINTIDESESVLFAFDSGGATDVAFYAGFSYRENDANRTMMFEGFAVGGASLGTRTFDTAGAVGGYTDVSGAFGDVVLSAFRIAGLGQLTGIGVDYIRFTEVEGVPGPPSSVPEPTTLVLCATGLVLAGYRKYSAAQRS